MLCALDMVCVFWLHFLWSLHLGRTPKKLYKALKIVFYRRCSYLVGVVYVISCRKISKGTGVPVVCGWPQVAILAQPVWMFSTVPTFVLNHWPAHKIVIPNSSRKSCVNIKRSKWHDIQLGQVRFERDEWPSELLFRGVTASNFFEFFVFVFLKEKQNPCPR